MTITTTEQQTKFALPHFNFNFNGTSVQSIEDEYHAAQDTHVDELLYDDVDVENQI